MLTLTDGAVSRVEISATTRPEDAFARLDPDKLSPKQHDIWYCRPYANSIAYQIMEAIPGSQAEQVRQVEQTEGTVLSRISGLMWLISVAALLAAAFAVSAAMATAVLERRGEIGLMRSLGASKAAIAALFYAESSLLALATGAARLPRRITARLLPRPSHLLRRRLDRDAHPRPSPHRRRHGHPRRHPRQHPIHPRCPLRRSRRNPARQRMKPLLRVPHDHATDGSDIVGLISSHQVSSCT